MENPKKAHLTSEPLGKEPARKVNKKLDENDLREKQLDYRHEEFRIKIRDNRERHEIDEKRRKSLMWTAISLCSVSYLILISLFVLAITFHDEVDSKVFLSGCGISGFISWTLKSPFKQLTTLYNYYFHTSNRTIRSNLSPIQKRKRQKHRRRTR